VVYRSPGATQLFWQNFEYSIEEAFNYTTNVIITRGREIFVALWSLFSLHTSITSEKVTLQSADIKTGSNKVPLPVF
jgi:hypothetical protein